MDYELTLTVKNAPLLNMMRASGYKTVSELSRASGISQGEIGKMVNLQSAAYRKDGVTIRDSVNKLADFLCVSPCELFPESHLSDPLVKNKFTAQLPQLQMHQLSVSSMEPDKFLEFIDTEETDCFADMVSSIVTNREKNILKKRFEEEKTYKQIGEEEGISTERVRQIEAKALRKLRHPRHNDKICEGSKLHGKTYFDDDGNLIRKKKKFGSSR